MRALVGRFSEILAAVGVQGICDIVGETSSGVTGAIRRQPAVSQVHLRQNEVATLAPEGLCCTANARSGGRCVRQRRARRRLAGYASGLIVIASAAAAQHHHPPQDEALHETFYSTWYMPDDPAKSCCNKADCYPTDIKYVGGSIYARRREDGKYILIPSRKVERNRDNPDGRNHLCAPPPNSYHPDDTVFCFSLGGGI